MVLVGAVGGYGESTMELGGWREGKGVGAGEGGIRGMKSNSMREGKGKYSLRGKLPCVHRVVLHVDVGGNWHRGICEPGGERGELAAFETAVLDGLSGVPVVGLGVHTRTETVELTVFCDCGSDYRWERDEVGCAGCHARPLIYFVTITVTAALEVPVISIAVAVVADAVTMNKH